MCFLIEYLLMYCVLARNMCVSVCLSLCVCVCVCVCVCALNMMAWQVKPRARARMAWDQGLYTYELYPAGRIHMLLCIRTSVYVLSVYLYVYHLQICISMISISVYV